MVLHPDAQRRAQKEIDDVVGMGRLPDFDDESSLPYVSALVNEVMRWHPVAPVGMCLSHTAFSHGERMLFIFFGLISSGSPPSDRG
jgi:cytochrome P450